MQDNDGFVREAVRLGVRSRSYFKLQEIDHKFRLFRPGQTVLDLGASPGGWCQYAVNQIGLSGTIYAVDVLEMKPIDRVHFIQCDISRSESVEELGAVIDGGKVDVVLSDMAPNLTGNASIDSRNFSDLYEAIFNVCHCVLTTGGHLVYKFFQDEDSRMLKEQCGSLFAECMVFKPKASRSRSQESYMVAQRYER